MRGYSNKGLAQRGTPVQWVHCRRHEWFEAVKWLILITASAVIGIAMSSNLLFLRLAAYAPVFIHALSTLISARRKAIV